MSFVNRRLAVALGAALVLTVWVNSVRADKPPRIPAYYDGQIVYVAAVSVSKKEVKAAIPAYLVLEGQDINHVLSAIPGVPGYNPHWHFFSVEFLNGVDPYLLDSEDAILDAEEDGDVMVTDLDFFVLCPVVSSSP